MNNEVSYSTMLSVTLIALAVVIGIATGLFGVVKATATTGKTAVEEQLGNLDVKLLKPMNGKVVNGDTVNTTLEQFVGKGLAVLISTKKFSSDNSSVKRDVRDYPILVKGNHKVMDTKGNQKEVNFINYNALLGCAYKKHSDNFQGIDYTGLELKSGIYNTSSGFQYSRDGNLLLDLDFSKTCIMGSSEYIKPDAKFKASLILNEDDKIVGIAFREF